MEQRAVRIGDNDVFTGREVRRLLETVKTKATAARWLKLADAADALQMKPDTLRRRCARWQNMDRPPVRVRKLSDANGSPWLLDEDDVWALARRAPRQGLHPVTVDGTDSANEDEGTTEAFEKLADQWCELVTKNL